MRYKIERRGPGVWRIHFEDHSMKQAEFSGHTSGAEERNQLQAIQKFLKDHEWDGEFCGPFGKVDGE